MQKLYRVAFHKILQKIGADKIELNFKHLNTLLKEKNIENTDENLFHRLPREQIKNFVRNPCPIDTVEQVNSEIVTISKQIRGSLNIVQKKICFKCPFVDHCQKAFIEPTPNKKTENALQRLLLSMKYAADLQKSDTIKDRSYLSGYRVCDSLLTIVDDLVNNAGADYNQFNKQRHALIENIILQQNEVNEQQLILKAKNSRVPLKDVYAQVPSSEKTANKSWVDNDNESDTNDENVFKKKASSKFIQIAQKYIGKDIEEDTSKLERSNRNFKKQKYENNDEDGVKNYKRQYKQQRSEDKYQSQDKRKDRKPERYNDRSNQRSNERYNDRATDNYQKKTNDRPNDRFNGRANQKYTSKFNQNQEDGQRKYVKSNYETKYNNSTRENKYDRQNKYEKNNTRNYESRGNDYANKYNNKKSYQKAQNSEGSYDERQPRIRRFSKEENRGNSYNADDKKGGSNKFYQKWENEEVFEDYKSTNQNGNIRNYKGKTNETKGPKSNATEWYTKEEKNSFQKMQKIPKILRTEYAPKDARKEQDSPSSQNQNQEGETERKGRRIKRT